MNLILIAASLIMGLSSDPVLNTDSKPVHCDIQVIHATRGDHHMDPKLQPIARYLNRSFGTRFQSFKLMNSSRLVLTKSQTGQESLPNKTTLSLTYLGVERALLRLDMAVGGLKTRVKVHDGGLFFQAGRSYKKGMLIVAIRAKLAR
jgi:hypothetical protein